MLDFALSQSLVFSQLYGNKIIPCPSAVQVIDLCMLWLWIKHLHH